MLVLLLDMRVSALVPPCTRRTFIYRHVLGSVQNRRPFLSLDANCECLRLAAREWTRGVAPVQ
jgi:hypothetical protein